MAKLSELKTLLATARKAAPEPGKPTPPPSAAARTVVRRKPVEVDIDLSQAFADVAPLPSRNRAPVVRVRPAGLPAKRLADEADALAMSKHGAEPSPATWDAGQENEAEQTFLRKGLATDVLTRLRRGHWFINDARNYGWRCVRVVHGKGLSSPNREPVLKGKVRRWLTQRDEVLAYCEAPRHSGGAGAVLVLLKASSA
jgi:DNA-nicking Smr family endonuclease